MSEPEDVVARRKGEHLRVAAGPDVGSHARPGWDDIRLLHQAIPTGELLEIDVSTEFLGRRLRAPLLIAGMTGGHPAASRVNEVLARAAERHGLAMGVGSQRAALVNPELAPTYAIARKTAPGAFLIANVGAAQLIEQHDQPAFGLDDLRRAVDMIAADAIAFHLNYLEESVQTEGGRAVGRLRVAMAEAVGSLAIPSIAKETGAGLSDTVAMELRDAGFRALDVGGLGGTSFAAVEARRAEMNGDARGLRLGEVFRDWGIPTPVSVVAAAPTGLPIIATGGVRSGLDAAKAIALGATLVGVARPLLVAALEGDAAVDEWLEQFFEELRVAVFLTGGRRLGDLRGTRRVVVGETSRWLDDLGYQSSILLDARVGDTL
jgi:isopentenyl-diphosphate Delta-isomerase